MTEVDVRKEVGFFFVFVKGCARSALGAQRPGGEARSARTAALGAAQRCEAPPQAAERRAGHKACFSAFNFAPIIEKWKMFTDKSARNGPTMRLGQCLGPKKWYGRHLKYLRYVPCFLSHVRTLLCMINTSTRCDRSHNPLAKFNARHSRNLLFVP